MRARGFVSTLIETTNTIRCDPAADPNATCKDILTSGPWRDLFGNGCSYYAETELCAPDGSGAGPGWDSSGNGTLYDYALAKGLSAIEVRITIGKPCMAR